MGNLIIQRFTGEFTRQADITPYAANDVVSSTSSGTIITELRPCSSAGLAEPDLVAEGSYQLKNLKLTKSTSSTTNATFDVYLYSSGVNETYHDNQPFALTYANKHTRVGKVSFTMATGGSTSDCAESIANDVNFTFKANKSASTGRANLFYQIVATAAYTPGVSEKFYLEAEILKIN